MRVRCSTTGLVVATATALWSAGSAVAAPIAGAPTGRCSLAIMHASVVPMDGERVLADRTVIVADGRIQSIAPSVGAPVQPCVATVDAHARYLVPGLNDMHVHLETVAFAEAFGVDVEPIDYSAEMALYLANGVTGIRVMSGAPDILAFRDSQRGSSSPYPHLVVGTPMLSGAPPVLPEPVTKVVVTADAARDAVREFRREGYDFIKVRDNLSAPVLRAVIDEARRAGLDVDGHISQGRGLSVFDVLRSGQRGIAHLDNLVLLMTDKSHDPATYARLLKACGCFVETTMQVEANAYAQLSAYDRLVQNPALLYMHPLLLRAFWRKPNNPYLSGGTDPKFFQDLYADDKILLKTLHDAGVHIVAGTDALNPMIIPGASLHDELASMVEAGLTPYEALQTATANPAAFVPGFDQVGILAPGRVANAILVESNPLDDIRALREPAATMINGHWMTREDLQRRLDAAAALYSTL
jgi:Amidohydrolase family